MPRDRHAVDPLGVRVHRLLPRGEVDRARERREHHELRERDAGALGELRREIEGGGPIARQAEDEGAEDVDVVMAERAQAIDQPLAAHVEVLVDVFQPFGRHRLDPDQRAADVRLAHRLEELRIFGRLHGDLRVEHHVGRQRGERVHQLEPLGAHRRQLLQPALVLTPVRRGEIVERHRIEVVVGERDEAEPDAPQGDDLVDDGVHRALPRPLAVGLPDRAERAVLRAAADRLHRRPHVFRARHERPARRLEIAAFNLAAFVDGLRRAARAVGEHRRPYEIAVAPDDGMRGAEGERLVGIERRVDAAEDDECPAGASLLADFVSVDRVAGVDADADDVAGRDGRRIPWIEGFVRDDRVAIAFGRCGRENVQPSWRDDADAERQPTRVDQMHLHSNSRLNSLRSRAIVAHMGVNMRVTTTSIS